MDVLAGPWDPRGFILIPFVAGGSALVGAIRGVPSYDAERAKTTLNAWWNQRSPGAELVEEICRTGIRRTVYEWSVDPKPDSPRAVNSIGTEELWLVVDSVQVALETPHGSGTPVNARLGLTLDATCSLRRSPNGDILCASRFVITGARYPFTTWAADGGRLLDSEWLLRKRQFSVKMVEGLFSSRRGK
jgi:hypothetical protein